MGMLAPKPLPLPLQRHQPPGRYLMVPGRSMGGGPRPISRGAAARRRMVFARLAGATAATGFVAVLFGGILWWPFVLSFLALSGYVGLAVQVTARQQERVRKIRRLPARPPRGMPAPQRVAVGGNNLRVRRY